MPISSLLTDVLGLFMLYPFQLTMVSSFVCVLCYEVTRVNEGICGTQASPSLDYLLRLTLVCLMFFLSFKHTQPRADTDAIQRRKTKTNDKNSGGDKVLCLQWKEQPFFRLAWYAQVLALLSVLWPWVSQWNLSLSFSPCTIMTNLSCTAVMISHDSQ